MLLEITKMECETCGEEFRGTGMPILMKSLNGLFQIWKVFCDDCMKKIEDAVLK